MVRKGCLVATPPLQLLTIPEVCDRLKLGRSKVSELIATGQLESLKIDGARRCTEDQVGEFIGQRIEAAKASA